MQRGHGFNRAIHREHAVHAGFFSGTGEWFIAHFVNRIQVAHQHHGRALVALAEAAHGFQYVGQAYSVGQGALGGALDGGAVRHRVGKRHAQLDDVRAVGGQAVHQLQRGFKVWVAGGDVGNQGFLAAIGLEDSCHRVYFLICLFSVIRAKAT